MSETRALAANYRAAREAFDQATAVLDTLAKRREALLAEREAMTADLQAADAAKRDALTAYGETGNDKALTTATKRLSDVTAQATTIGEKLEAVHAAMERARPALAAAEHAVSQAHAEYWRHEEKAALAAAMAAVTPHLQRATQARAARFGSGESWTGYARRHLQFVQRTDDGMEAADDPQVPGTCPRSAHLSDGDRAALARQQHRERKAQAQEEQAA